MAYDNDKLIKTALSAIEKHRLVFIDELINYLPCALSTFYAKELEKTESIKEALYKNKITKKSKIRNKWEDGDNFMGQMAFYKLVADDNELDRLTTNSNKTNLNLKIDKTGLTDKELNDQIKDLEED